MQVIGSMLVLLLLVACGTPRGAINGHIVGANTGEPLKDAQIILCLLPETEGVNFLCTLQATPTALSDASGVFTFSDVNPGAYVLMYGLSDELASTPDEWGDVKVTKAKPCMRGMKNAVCQSLEAPEGLFWQAGGTYLGEVIFRLGVPDDETESTVIGTGGGTYTFQGAVRSDHTGISIMVSDGELAPVVRVQAGETTEIEWQAMGR